MKSDMNKYKGYFKNHFSAKFAKSDVDRDQKWFYTQFKFIRSLVNIGEGAKILEIGSGFGGLYDYLKGIDYTGIEMDPEVVNFAKDFFKTDKFLNVSLEEFNIKNKFDYIFAIEVLEHFSDPISNIAKIKDLLNNRGMFIGTSPYPYKKNITADLTHNFVLHPENWKRLFFNAGFRKFRCFPMSFFPFVWRINKFFNIRIPLYLSLPYFISTSLFIAEK